MSDVNPTVVLVAEKARRITLKRVLVLTALVTTAVVSAKLARSETFATKAAEITEVVTN